MQRFRSSLPRFATDFRSAAYRAARVSKRFQATAQLLVLCAATVFAQTPSAPPPGGATASEKPNADVVRVGKRLRCKCGCGDTIATCSMLQCEYSKPGKEQIAKMQSLGMTDDQIVNKFVQNFGADILLSPPSPFGWIVPYLAILPGLALILLFVKKYRKPKALVEVGTIEIDDPALEKYKDQIEKDLANME
jgi:cytochrome c-type biogenesis protein CcmH